MFDTAMEFLKVRTMNLELSEADRARIKSVFRDCFEMTDEELHREIFLASGEVNSNGNGHAVLDPRIRALEEETDLLDILPKRGLIADYVEYTSRSEAPLAYHLFSILCGLGAVVNRRVYLSMGYYRVFPAIGVIILGPSGIKKTSAADITVKMLQEMQLIKIYSEKLTPEALVDAMKTDATGLIYAPEMTVFLNKQKYNEGLVQMITRFMDCPDFWESGTIMRGKHALREIAISCLMCSTSDWFIRSTPEDSFGGGFIARNLLVVQEAPARCEPIPNPGDSKLRDRLVQRIAEIHSLSGEMILSRVAMAHYQDWYRNEHQTESLKPEHELLASYYQRKPDHIKRIAILLHLVEHGGFELCDRCFDRALKLLNWLEQYIPRLLQQMFRSSTGEEIELVLKVVRNAGLITHSDLIRKLGYRMDAARVKSILGSLKEAGQVAEQNDPMFGHSYRLSGVN